MNSVRKNGHLMKRKLTRTLGPLLALSLFTAALWALHHELKTYGLHDILSHLHEISGHALLSALSLTVLSYLLMTGYDALALRHIRHPLSYGKTALASFIGYTFSNNIGLSMIAGASVRYRLYTAWGLTPFETTQVIGFCTLTLWLGFFAVGGIIFLTEPGGFPTVLHASAFSSRPVGVLLLGLVALYLFWSFLRKPPLKIGGWLFTVPPVHLSFIQVIFASLDWLVAATVLFVLMPATPQISYGGFVFVFMTAQLAGLISQIPGGLGVFEKAVIMILSPALPAPKIIGSLVAYRAIYYLLPFLLGACFLGIQEIVRYRTAVGRVAKTFGRWMSFSVPQIMAFTTFLGGAILLFSGATPAALGRLAWLKKFMPLPAIEISHFLGSLVGGGLLLIARGLQRRINAAYVLTALLLAGGIVFSLLKGLDYEEAAILVAMLAALLPCRSHFYRSASFFEQNSTPGWTIAIVAVLICSLWLGFFSYKHVEFAGDLWWEFTFSGNAPRFLRAIVGIMAGMSFYALARLLSPTAPRAAGAGRAEMERVNAIVEKATMTYANLALLGDKSFLFSKEGNAFIMYGIDGRS
jgi:phosphatidylglycerol lysyltransferase